MINLFLGHKDYSQPPVAHSNRDQRVVSVGVKGWQGGPSGSIQATSSSGGSSGGSSTATLVSGGQLPVSGYVHTLGGRGATAQHSPGGGRSRGISPGPQLTMGGSLAGLMPSQADIYREYRRAAPAQNGVPAAPQVYVATTQPTYLPSTLPPAHQVNPFTPG